MQIKLLSFTICALITTFSCNLKPEVFQYKDKEDPEKFFVSIDFSQDGFNNFISSVYNNPEYAQDFLPNNFDHFTKFLEHGLHSHQSRTYEQQVIRLFANKVKSCSYINSSAFSIALQKMPSLLKSFFIEPKKTCLHVLQENVNTILYDSFLEKFSLFKENPDSFLNNLTTEIVQVLGDNIHKNDISIEELRKTTLIFLDGSLSKLIWSPTDGIDTWHSVKKIAQQLATLMDYSIITDPDDLNSLYITLVERYCFFIDIASLDIPTPFYHEIKKDIFATSSLCLFTAQEQDELILAKKDRLLSAITQAELQAYDVHRKELSVIT